MSSLTSIRLLVHKMTSEEKKVAFRFLTAFSVRGANAPNQALKLFELLCREAKDKKQLEDKQVEALVYPNNKGGIAFHRLIFRLRDKLFESLLLSVNLERPNSYSERGRALHEIRKSLSQAQILQSKGTWDLVLAVLDECIEKASKYEHYEEWAAALRVRIEMRTIDEGKETFESENYQYEKVIQGLIASKKALEYYVQLGSSIQFKSARVSLDLLEEQINELHVAYEVTNSANVAFFMHYLEAHYYQEKKQLKLASAILRQQAELVEKHPALYSKSRLSGVLINLANNELLTKRFASVLRITEKISDLLTEKHFNLFVCHEINFYAYFYTRKYEKALKSINMLLQHDNSSTANYRIGIRVYLKACVLFMQGEHSKVQKILREMNPIEDDKEGWNISIKMLTIMNDIELNKIDNAENRIENMRKLLAKLKRRNIHNPRESSKFEILRTLINTDLDFVETRNKKGEELEKLASRLPDYEWRIKSPELIIFDQWFSSKVFKQNLMIKIPPYHESAA